MKNSQKELVIVNGSKYVLIPFYMVEEYGLEKGGFVEYDRSDPGVLTLRVKQGGGKA